MQSRPGMIVGRQNGSTLLSGNSLLGQVNIDDRLKTYSAIVTKREKGVYEISPLKEDGNLPRMILMLLRNGFKDTFNHSTVTVTIDGVKHTGAKIEVKNLEIYVDGAYVGQLTRSNGGDDTPYFKGGGVTVGVHYGPFVESFAPAPVVSNEPVTPRSTASLAHAVLSHLNECTLIVSEDIEDGSVKTASAAAASVTSNRKAEANPEKISDSSMLVSQVVRASLATSSPMPTLPVAAVSAVASAPAAASVPVVVTSAAVAPLPAAAPAAAVTPAPVAAVTPVLDLDTLTLQTHQSGSKPSASYGTVNTVIIGSYYPNVCVFGGAAAITGTELVNDGQDKNQLARLDKRR